MPIYDYECKTCGKEFENIEVWSSHKAKTCKFCGSKDIKRIVAISHVRMDSDPIKHSLPDPSPPLRELVGGSKYGAEGGFKELENDKRTLREYTRKRDKHGNSIWIPKERKYFDFGKTA